MNPVRSLVINQCLPVRSEDDFDHWSKRFFGLGILIGETTDIYLHIRDSNITVHVIKSVCTTVEIKLKIFL
jgi:hypothetical protein